MDYNDPTVVRYNQLNQAFIAAPTTMAVNLDKSHLWKADIARSVDMCNGWFLSFAPVTFRSTRAKTTAYVREALEVTENLFGL
jgi:hypothetical protein